MPNGAFVKMAFVRMAFVRMAIAAKALRGQRFRCPSIHIFLDIRGEAGAAAPKGSMTYAFTSPSICPSIHLGLKQVSSSRSVVPLTNLL